MAYLTKKNVEWNIEEISAMSTAHYNKPMQVVATSESLPSCTNMVSTSSLASAVTSHAAYTNLPSLAPLAGQEITEVNVITRIPPQVHMEVGTVYGQREQDRKARREIANSNERRRMQSINAGFKSLKSILPQVAGEKLSKATILQQTAEYILQLDGDKNKLVLLNEKYRAALSRCKCDNPKRKALMSALLNEGLEKDEGIGSPREEFEDVGRDAVEIRLQLDKERRMRIRLEEKIREIEQRFSLDKVSVTASTAPGSPAITTTPSSSQSSTQHRICVPKAGNYFGSTLSIVNQPSVISTPEVSSPVQTVPLGADGATFEDRIEQVEVISKSILHQHHQTMNDIDMARSRQPLKKRVVEIIEEGDSPKQKVSKLQVPSAALETAVNSAISVAGLTSKVFVHPNNTPLFAVTDNIHASLPVSIHTTEMSQLDREKLIHAAGFLNNGQRINASEQSVLLPANPTTAPTYITLSPNVSWPASQTAQTSTNYSIAVKPNSASSLQSLHPHYVLQSNVARVPGHPEEITLNQLNAAPLSMTLTQLNAVPNMTRLSSTVPPSGAALPVNRVQTHYLPVVAMDTVLNQQSDRRLSNGTTDSAPSDEDSKTIDERAFPKQPEGHPGSICTRRTKSDPVMTNIDVNNQEISSNSVVVAPTTPVHSTNSGSSLVRQIDKVATRRNLETIVQAIDHLEQQERRNSQDKQSNLKV